MMSTSDGSGGAHAVFAWLIGQEDNVGDTVLRRAYADVLRSRGPVHAYVGRVSEDFVDGLGLRDDDTVYSRFLPWLSAIIRASSASRVTVAFNAGEFALSRLFAAMAGGLLVVLPRVKKHGGKVVWLGAAVPDGGRQSLRPIFERLFRSADMVIWRDTRSSANLGKAPSMPDWAFAVGSQNAGTDRPSLGVSLRFDRDAPSEAWISRVRLIADRLMLEPVVVAQVKRDSERAEELAIALGGRAVPYRAGTHSGQEEVVRTEYRKMNFVLSDRLHVLIMAATEGAIPLAWCESTTGKIGRHFDVVGLTWVADSDNADLDTLDRDRLHEMRRDVARATGEAREALEAVATKVRLL
jgi:polysaccharide pyruvyl transferase WcaK-like protein